MRTAVIYSDVYLRHRTPEGHPESPERLRRILNALRENGILGDKCEIVEPRSATIDEICLVHDPSYVEKIEDLCSRGGGQLDEDTFASQETFQVALLAAGGVLKACELVLKKEYDNAMALVRPPGHHAGVKKHEGFCVFNNVAIGAKWALNRGLKRVAIVDIDAHHGNGTQEIFYDTSEVLYIGLHQSGETIYPGTGFWEEIGEGDGKGYTANVPLPPRTEDLGYRTVFKRLVLPLLREYEPELVLVSLGFDPHHADPLTDLWLSAYGFREIADMLVGVGKGPVCVLEGGYGPGLEDCACAFTSRLCRVPYAVKDRRMPLLLYIYEEVLSSVERTVSLLSKYWELL